MAQIERVGWQRHEGIPDQRVLIFPGQLLRLVYHVIKALNHGPHQTDEVCRILRKSEPFAVFSDQIGAVHVISRPLARIVIAVAALAIVEMNPPGSSE